MMTRVPHFSTLRSTSEPFSKVHTISELFKIIYTLKLLPLRRLQLRTKQLQQQFTLDLRRQLRHLVIFHVHMQSQ